MMSSKLWRHGENWPQRFDLSLPLYDLSLDIMVPGVWQIFRADCAVILRYCKSKSDKKCRSYLTLKHSRFLNLQFPQFFKGLKRGLLTKIRCSQWLQGMVLDGIKGFQWTNSGSMTFNFKSDAWSCVLPLLILKGIRTFILCKLFERNIPLEKLEEIGVEGPDNMFMINTVDDNFDENWNK